ncbi:hypothetical protein V1527DRAFT_472159 [Lipomyces starkeyi]
MIRIHECLRIFWKSYKAKQEAALASLTVSWIDFIHLSLLLSSLCRQISAICMDIEESRFLVALYCHWMHARLATEFVNSPLVEALRGESMLFYSHLSLSLTIHILKIRLRLLRTRLRRH